MLLLVVVNKDSSIHGNL